MVQDEVSADSRKAIRRMKGTAPSFPGKGQIANGTRCWDRHSGWANNVSSNPGHRPTSHSWSFRRRHSNLPSSINSRANKVCNVRRHRSMPTDCSISSAIASPKISEGLIISPIKMLTYSFLKNGDQNPRKGIMWATDTSWRSDDASAFTNRDADCPCPFRL